VTVQSPNNPFAAFLKAVAAMAEAGAKDHDRWLTARRLCERKLEGRRRNSRMGAAIELVMARPIVNAALIARALEIMPRPPRRWSPSSICAS
jgi:hypothetical protein